MTLITQHLIKELVINASYTSSDIARLIGATAGYVSRSGGVITRSEENFLILIINLKKRVAATQYVDHLDGSTLYWEGQTSRKFAEKRMQAGTDEIFPFIRHEASGPYTYYGRAVPVRMKIFPLGTPSQVIMHLYEHEATTPQFSAEEISEQSPLYVPRNTEARRYVNVRTVQRDYRDAALTLWGNECAVTEISNQRILIASHIKPWRDSTNEERIDPKNSLILSPTYDRLFDLGYISFDPRDGRIWMSDVVDDRDWDKLHVDDSRRLKKVPEGVDSYLHYHNTYVFDFSPSGKTIEELLIG
ncbi:HNH endonuclease [Parasphaerochaeta coccoides]|uniref:HNH nuclease domain-containing protein n=1 Tax=Parasphaerochaeta coccoides (strain ATCC BAA-1237 / DSM 17374 / SPN1) TaxID=760011 RepID=F4GL16_PARC1|nr:HNH endonuclease signature motif containing protein [Parasphaerochaeta coccoides]AEC02356.1 hypothetical protein Spico_1137 [Parasphaerochaeta coccoides DSM 17374]